MALTNLRIMQAVLENILNQEVTFVKNKDDRNANSDANELYRHFYKVTGFDLLYCLQQYEEYSDFKAKFDRANGIVPGAVASSKKAAIKPWEGQITAKTLIQTIKMDVRSTDTITSIKNKIRDKEEVALNLQRVYYKEKQLEDDKTLADYNISKGAQLNMMLRMTPCMHIYVKTLAGTRLRLEVEEGDTVSNIKNIVQEKEGLPANQQRLVYQGQNLRDGQTLKYYGIGENHVVYLLLKLRQGNQFFAKTPTGKLVTLDLGLNDKLEAAKTQIFNKEYIPIAKQIISFPANKELDDRKTFKDYNLQKEDTLELTFKTKDRYIFNEVDVFDPAFDFDFTELNDAGKTFRRGGRNYERPCGWKRIAFQVKNKYENEVWLGSTDATGEWPVAYHGINPDGMKSIGFDGFDLPKIKRFPNAKAHFVTPKMEYAVNHSTEIVIDGVRLKFLIKSRINPQAIIERKDGNYWFLPSENDLRPYGIIYMVEKASK